MSPVAATPLLRAGRTLVDGLTVMILILVLMLPSYLLGRAKLPGGVIPWLQLILPPTLALLPRIAISFKDYSKLWHGTRIAASYVLYTLLYPFNAASRLALRIGPWWAVAGILAFVGVHYFLTNRIAANLSERWVVDAATFVDETAIEPRSWSSVRSLIERSHDMQPNLAHHFPATVPRVRSWEVLYPSAHPTQDVSSKAFQDRLAASAKLLSRNQSGYRSLDGVLAKLFLARLYFRLSNQGQDMLRVQEARSILADSTLSMGLREIHGAGLAPGYAAARDISQNLDAILKRSCALHFKEYAALATMSGERALDQETLFNGADIVFARAAGAPEDSLFRRARALNNRLDLLLQRLRLYAQVSHSNEPTAMTMPNELLTKGEALLRELRTDLLSTIPSVPKAEHFMTLAQTSCFLAHSELQGYLLCARYSDPDTTEYRDRGRYEADLAVRFLDMSLRMGLDPVEVERAPHDLGLCFLLSVDRMGLAQPPEILDERMRAIRVLGEHGISYRCDICRSPTRRNLIVGAASR